MPESRKRPKKNREEEKAVYKNPLKKKWGRIVIIILVFGFLLGTVAGTFLLLFEMLK
ncbi:MAG: hypothetical protein ACLFRI_03075 [Candidatus Izemoplasmataceae bacterium]